MKNYDGLLNRKEKEKYIGCSALANEKKAAWVASCDRYLKKKKKKKRQREREKKRKNILVVRLWPMKRKQPGLLRVIDIS